MTSLNSMRSDPFNVKQSGGDIKDRVLKLPSDEIDGDILLSRRFQKHPRHFFGKFQNNRVLFYFCLLLFTLFTLKLYYLQIIQGRTLAQAAEKNRIRELPRPAPRGLIFDRHGQKLAYNVPDFSVFVIPADLPSEQPAEDKMFQDLAKIVKVAPFDLVEQFSRTPRASFLPVKLASGLSQTQAIQFLKKERDWQGLFLQATYGRAYASQAALAHALGFLGKISEEELSLLSATSYVLSDLVGKAGVEKFYEQELHGRSGAKLIEVDAQGKVKNALGERPPSPGAALHLNIDAKLQEAAWQALTEIIKQRKSPGGSVVALNPKSGEILALASFPSYDNRALSAGLTSRDFQALISNPDKPLFNRAVSGEYPSGSTFKLVVAAAALADGLINENFTVLSVGGFSIGKYHFPDWKAGGHGRTNIIKALAESVNTFFYVIGGGRGDNPGLGWEKMTAYGRGFGLAKKTGIDLPAEADGFLPGEEWKLKNTGERWFLGDTYHLAIGQGDVLVTPLQIAVATAVIANGGTLISPRLASRIVSPDGRARLIAPKIINEQVIPAAAAKTVQRGLRAAVTSGTARSLAGLPVPLAGKTGTAEYSEDKKNKPHAWFTGFGPYDSPEIVVTVLVEQGGAGNLTATPVAKKIFEYYFKNKIANVKIINR